MLDGRSQKTGSVDKQKLMLVQDDKASSKNVEDDFARENSSSMFSAELSSEICDFPFRHQEFPYPTDQKHSRNSLHPYSRLFAGRNLEHVASKLPTVHDFLNGFTAILGESTHEKNQTIRRS